MHHSLLSIPLAISLIAGPGPSDESIAPLSDRERAVHLLSRFSSGVREVDVARVLEIGTEAWIDEQLEPGTPGPLSLSKRLLKFETLGMSPFEVYQHTETVLPAGASRKDRIERDKRRAIPMRQLLHSVALRSIYSDRQLEEVLCDFWRNHFNVSFTKTYPAHLYIHDYERRVVQAHVLGSFEGMLSASAHHPAMMHYLDNALSRRPPSAGELAKIETKVRQETGSKERGREAAAIAAQRGLNENYARELLELHTLGVDRTYKQKDVIAAAEALTGWGLADGSGGNLGFAFDFERHIDDDFKFLGHVLRRDKEKGPGQGERLLEIVARHEDTADFIAMKLVRYFVNDEAPSSLIKDVAKTFKKSGGDIPAMVRTILESEEFWSRRNYQSKFKTPREFLVSALRVTDAEVENFDLYFQALKAMGQLTYHCDDPTGWYDTADSWLDPGVMAKRWEVALLLAANRLDGIRVPDSFYGSIDANTTPLAWMQEMVQKVLPAGASTRTLAMLHEVVREHTMGEAKADVRKLGPRVLGLLLGSPEFQQQ